MRLFTRPFRLERVDRLTDACSLLREHGGDAKVLAGGQSLLPMVNMGLLQPGVLIDISRVAGGREVTVDDGYLTIGALVTHAALAADPLARRQQPLLGAAAGLIGDARVRGRGTLGGSLAHSDPAAELPLVMVALGAAYELADGRGTRTLSAEEFHLRFLTTELADDEIVVSARVPTLGPGWGWSFQELSRRPGDFPVASAAVAVRGADGVIIESRVAVGGVGDRPVRLADVETALTGATPGQVDGRIGPIHGIRPVTDANATASYRARVCRVLVTRAIGEAARRSAKAAA
jgi:aerobic carbon-monoxide dehydrogenase medium subunit